MNALRRRLEGMIEPLRLTKTACTICDADKCHELADDIERLISAYLILMRCVQVDPQWPWDAEVSFMEHAT